MSQTKPKHRQVRIPPGDLKNFYTTAKIEGRSFNAWVLFHLRAVVARKLIRS